MTGRFWYLPLKDVVPAEQRLELATRDEVSAKDLPPNYTVPAKLFGEGVRVGDILALHDGDQVVALARVLELDGKGSLRWRRLPLLTAAKPVATPELSEIEAHESAQFTVGVDALLRDDFTPVAVIGNGLQSQRTYRPTAPPSNVILYGPPGTGKTHSVRRRALELLGDAGAITAPADDINAEWDRLRRDGQIVFCTFHQAFAYEEFIEGLRAVTDDSGNVRYEMESGVFKRLALRAAAEATPAVTARTSAPDFDTLWETMIAEIKSEDFVVRRSSSSKSYKIEVSGQGNLNARPGKETDDGGFEVDQDMAFQTATKNYARIYWEKRQSLGPAPAQISYEKARQAIAESTGGGGGHHYAALWIAYVWMWELHRNFTGLKRGKDPVMDPIATLASGGGFAFHRNCKQYVLIIDEINRANIARVFGELITLLEPDKRLGNPNELRVQLPGSKEWFGVPPNLHIIGTMNTADRSIALMDVALRRRFIFEEMMPDANVLKAELEKAEVPADLVALVVAVFEKLNLRLRYLYDREHQIGHAYFLGIRTLQDLRQAFADRILPLIQEYFFGQWDKVALALGYPIKADGAPKEMRGTAHANGTFLTAQKLDEKTVLGFDHDEYVDQVAWDVHPAFRPRGKADDDWLKQAFDELTRVK